jgi:hypothetical protein
MSTRIWLDLEHPANLGVLKSLQGGAGKKRKRAKASPVADPDSVSDPYFKCGSHPDVVEYVWDRLGECLPENGRCLVYGTPSLVQARAGIVLAVCYGTEYCLRIPADRMNEAITAGLTTSTQWSDGTQTDLAAEFGPDWLFGQFYRDEPQWLRGAYDSYRPKGESKE